MLAWPDWNKLYAAWNCLYYWEPRSDEQWEALDNAKSVVEREALVRKFREEYLKNRDIATWKLLESAKVEEVKEEPKEEEQVEVSIEDVKPAKTTTKKGK
jgi:hypothetical protein